MQNFLVGTVGFEEDLGDLLLHFRGSAGGFWDELDQVTGVLEEGLDPGDVGKVIFTAFGWDGEVAGLLDQVAGALDAFGCRDETGHRIPLLIVFENSQNIEDIIGRDMSP
jgi:hypothetical protein